MGDNQILDSSFSSGDNLMVSTASMATSTGTATTGITTPIAYPSRP